MESMPKKRNPRPRLHRTVQMEDRQAPHRSSQVYRLVAARARRAQAEVREIQAEDATLETESGECNQTDASESS